jgi:hypothetical protein
MVKRELCGHQIAAPKVLRHVGGFEKEVFDKRQKLSARRTTRNVGTICRGSQSAGQPVLVNEHSIADIELIWQTLARFPQQFNRPEREINLAAVCVLRHPTGARWVAFERTPGSRGY